MSDYDYGIDISVESLLSGQPATSDHGAINKGRKSRNNNKLMSSNDSNLLSSVNQNPSRRQSFSNARPAITRDSPATKSDQVQPTTTRARSLASSTPHPPSFPMQGSSSAAFRAPSRSVMSNPLHTIKKDKSGATKDTLRLSKSPLQAPISSLGSNTMKLEDFDYGFDALGINVDHFRNKDGNLRRSGSSKVHDSVLPALTRTGGFENSFVNTSFLNNINDSFPSLRKNDKRGEPLLHHAPTQKILARQLPSESLRDMSVSTDRNSSIENSKLVHTSSNTYDYNLTASGAISFSSSSEDEMEEIPLVTTFEQTDGSKMLSMLTSKQSTQALQRLLSPSGDDDFVRDLFPASSYPPAYDTQSARSGSLTSSAFSPFLSPEDGALPVSSVPGITRWIGPLPKENVSTLIGKDDEGPASRNQEVDLNTWEAVDSLAIIEHKGALPSASALVSSPKDRRVIINQNNKESSCDVDECIVRQTGCTLIPSVLLSNTQKQFCRNGENVFVVVIDQTESGKSSNVPITPTLEIGTGVVKECIEYALEFKKVSTQLRLSLIYYLEGGDYIDLISNGGKDEGIRPLEVASSPIFGHCADNCQWLLVESVDDFTELVECVQGRVDAKFRGILITQFLLKTTLPPPPGSQLQNGDVIVSSFSLACTPFPDLYESILDQRPNTKWQLFRYALCKGPCAVLVTVCLDENDPNARAALNILQRMKNVPHPRPRRGSFVDYITKQREEAANLEWKKGFAKGDSKRFDILLNRNKSSTDDAVAFLKDSDNVYIPIYVDSKRRASFVLTKKASDFLRTRKLPARPPQSLILLHSAKSPYEGQTPYSKDEFTVCEKNVLKIVTGLNDGGNKSFSFDEIAEKDSHVPKTLAFENLSTLTKEGFNTCFLLVSPKGDCDSRDRLQAQHTGVVKNLPIIVGNARQMVKNIFALNCTSSSPSSPSGTSNSSDRAGQGSLLSGGSVATSGSFTYSKYVNVSVCFYLVSNTRSIDLLANKTCTPCELVVNAVGGLIPKNVVDQPVTDVQAFDKLIKKGESLLEKNNFFGNSISERNTGFVALVVKLVQMSKEDRKSVVISSMTNVSLGEKYELLDNKAELHSLIDVNNPQKPASTLLASFLCGPTASVCAGLVNPKFPALDTLDMINTITKVCLNFKSRNIPQGKLVNFIEHFDLAKEKLKNSKAPNNLLKQLNTMIEDLKKVEQNPSVPLTYYSRWKGDFSEFEMTSENSEEGTSSALTSESTRYRQQQKYFGTNYRKDPLRVVDGDVQTIGSVIVLNKQDTSSMARIGSPNTVEVSYKGVTNRVIKSVDLVEISSDTQGLKSNVLAYAVSAVVAGRSAALVALDTDDCDILTSISWLTLRTSINRLFWSLKSRPCVVSIRIMLIKEESVFDLLSGYQDISSTQVELTRAKISPFCGPVFTEAANILVQNAAEVDAALSAAVTSASFMRKKSPNNNLDGSIAIQFVVHQVFRKSHRSQKWTKGWSMGTKESKSGSRDADVLVSSLWCVCGGSSPQWLKARPLSASKNSSNNSGEPAKVSAQHEQEDSAVMAIHRFLIGGPCYTSVILGLTSLDSKKASYEIVKFRHMAELFSSLQKVPLREPRFGSLLGYQEYLDSLLTDLKKNNSQSASSYNNSVGEEGTARLSALLMETRVVLQRRFDITSSNVDVPLSSLAHNAKIFSVLEV